MSDRGWRPLGTMFHNEAVPDYLAPGEGFWKGEHLPPGRYRVGDDPWIEFELRGERALTNLVWIPEVRDWPYGEFPLAVAWTSGEERYDGYPKVAVERAAKALWDIDRDTCPTDVGLTHFAELDDHLREFYEELALAAIRAFHDEGSE